LIVEKQEKRIMVELQCFEMFRKRKIQQEMKNTNKQVWG
jgi:hypothetical protein